MWMQFRNWCLQGKVSAVAQHACHESQAKGKTSYHPKEEVALAIF